MDSFPPPINYVGDFENVLNEEDENEINTIIANYEKETTTQFAIITVDSMYTVQKEMKDYATTILNFYGVGQKDKNNGVVFCFSKKAKQIGIANGYGIEKIIKDSISKKILDSTVIPNFIQNKFRENSKILVIEDEPLNQVLFQALAEDLGLNIIIAGDAAIGFAEIENAEKSEKRFDLIFMDIHLPGMNGIDAASLIRNKLNKDIPIIGISADAFIEQQMKALEVGMNGYLTKPIEFEKLYNAFIIVVVKYFKFDKQDILDNIEQYF